MYFSLILSCRIQNYESGECMSHKQYEKQMPFCAQEFEVPGVKVPHAPIVTYDACVPKYNEDFPDHTIKAKDTYIRNMYLIMVEERIHWERDEYMRSEDLHWVGDNDNLNMTLAAKGAVKIRFWNEHEEDPRGRTPKYYVSPDDEFGAWQGGRRWNDKNEEEFIEYNIPKGKQHTPPRGFGMGLNSIGEATFGNYTTAYPPTGEHKLTDCELAFRNYICFMNFPRCNEEEESLVLCKSVCENFMIACGYERDLWRCGPSEFHNGYEPEIPELNLTEGRYTVFLRNFFPGQPFRENTFDFLGNPHVTCTPSMHSSTTRTRINYFLLLTLTIIAIFL